MPLRRLLKRTPSEYPEEALAKGIGGMAFVDIAVNPAGEVTAAVFVTGPEEFRVAALKTAAALRFEPMPEATAMRVSVNYQIRSDSSNVAISWWNTSGVHTFSTTARSRRGASAVIWEQNAVTRNERVPRKLKHVVPDYPAAAREAGIHGMVILEASVDSQGSVTDTRVVHSIPQLDRAAIDAVSQWQYEPTIVDGTAVPITVTVTVDFMGADLR